MNTNISRIIIGAAAFVVGALLLIDALNIVNTTPLLADWWPLLIILGGIAVVASDKKSYLWALIIIAIGVITQLRVLGYSDVNPWQIFWPLVLIVIGISVVLKRPTLSRGEPKDGTDDVVAILGGSDHKNTSDDFTGGKVTALLGGAKIDLRKATIKKEATVEAFVLMGGVELVVPRGTAIVNKTNAILGAAENQTDQELTKSSPTLTVVGDVIMGAIEIKN